MLCESAESLPKSLIPFLLFHALIPSIMNALNMHMHCRMCMYLSVEGKMADLRIQCWKNSGKTPQNFSPLFVH